MNSKHKTCEKCREKSRLQKQRKRKRDKEDEGPKRRVACGIPLAEIGAATAPLMIPSYTYILSDDEKTSDDEVCLTRIQEPLNKVY